MVAKDINDVYVEATIVPFSIRDVGSSNHGGVRTGRAHANGCSDTNSNFHA